MFLLKQSNCIHELDKFKYKINYFFKNFTKFVSNYLSFYETNSLTIRSEQLFDCKSNVNISSNKCIDNFDIKKNIYANKEFGICFEFVDKNQSINLNETNFIEILIKYEIQRNIIHIKLLPDLSITVIINILTFL